MPRNLWVFTKTHVPFNLAQIYMNTYILGGTQGSRAPSALWDYKFGIRLLKINSPCLLTLTHGGTELDQDCNHLVIYFLLCHS